MGLNIKNQRVHDLARQAAELTGKSQTGAIEEALVRLLRDHGADPAERGVSAKIDLVHRIVADYHQAEGNRTRTIVRVQDLYDEATGMPA